MYHKVEILLFAAVASMGVAGVTESAAPVQTYDVRCDMRRRTFCPRRLVGSDIHLGAD